MTWNMSVETENNITASVNLDENDDKIRGSSKASHQSTNKMFSIGRELCFLLLIIFTTYASFSSHGNLGNGPPPTPFFPRGSLVADFYRGELADALLRASEGDISFIMYYAPWDAESQVARRHFQAVAQQHYKQVYFAGINCWQPRSDCKRTLNKIQHFPKLVAYVTHETGIEYRGPCNTQYMSAFLQNVMRPLHRLYALDDLVRLRSAYNAVLVAYLNFHGLQGGPPYRAIYETALKYLERDVRQEVAFAVVTSFKTTLEMGGNRTPCIKLYLWNETLDYQGHLSADSLSEWVTSHLHQVSLWLSPPGVKSLTLAPYVNQGPALLMFTPLENFVMYDLLREVGLEYYNCNNSSDVTLLAQNISTYVSERISQIRRIMLSCQSRSHDFVSTVQIVNSVWTNTSCGKCRKFPSDECSQCYNPTGQCKTKSAVQKTIMTSMVIPDQDPLSAFALSDWAWKEKCRTLMPPPARLPAAPLPLTLRGLACHYNQSVSLLALDSSLFAHFARGLGVDLDLAKDSTKIVLLNSQMETTYVLNEPVTRQSLAQFLVNFTQGKLERFHRTQPPHVNTAPDVVSSLSDEKIVTVSVTELTSETFLSVAFNDSLNVVVFFYTPHCAFCHTLSHMYLSAARLLRNVPMLMFTRLDGENNDLPWQFTAPHYPSILFFPARRKSESRVFAARVGITVDSLTQFVLANLPLELRLLAMLELCQLYPEAHFSARRRECVLDVRREVTEGISMQLSQYRSLSLHVQPSRHQRGALRKVMNKLQHLKQLQLSLSVDSSRTSHLTKQFFSQLEEESVENSRNERSRTKDEL